MKTQIEKLVSLARMVADAHMNYHTIGEIVRHTPNVRVHQMYADKSTEFTTVFFNVDQSEFIVRFSNYRGTALEFNFHDDIEQELNRLADEVEESLVEWFASYHEDIEQIRLNALEKRRQALIKLTNEINEMEGKS